MKSGSLTLTKQSSFILEIGRIFFGAGIMGLGLMHFFPLGIRPTILPDLMDIRPGLYILVYFVAVVLIGTGMLIVIGKKYNTLSLIMGIAFLLLFLFAHLPKFLAAESYNKYWVQINKVLALSGGFLAISTINAPKPGNKIVLMLAKMGPVGMYLFAIMLYNFAVGHINNLKGLSSMVPKYIPFPACWTFLGGITLMGAAISIFTGFKVEKISLLLALNLFIWLVMLHIYYTVLYPNWQQGENFIGSVTCLSFCGTALVISQTAGKSIATSGSN